jgi:hypothetical protein
MTRSNRRALAICRYRTEVVFAPSRQRMEYGMSDFARASRTRRRLFRGLWVSVLLAAIAVALLLIAILGSSKHNRAGISTCLRYG